MRGLLFASLVSGVSAFGVSAGVGVGVGVSASPTSSRCPTLSSINYGLPYCEVANVNLSSESPGTAVLTIWKSADGESAADTHCEGFHTLDAAEIKSVFPGMANIKNGPRRWVTTCVGRDAADMSKAYAQPFRQQAAREIAGVSLKPQAQIQRSIQELMTLQASAAGAGTGTGGGDRDIVENPVARDAVFVWAAGQEVYELVSPDGWPYVMQSMATIADPDLTIQDLSTLGARLRLPAGWSFRVRVLEEDLVVVGQEGTVAVIQDELLNSYSKHDSKL